MMEYRVVSTSDQDKLAEEITRCLCDGWLLYGGVVVASSFQYNGPETKHYSVFTQALVKGSANQMQSQIIGFAPIAASMTGVNVPTT